MTSGGFLGAYYTHENPPQAEQLRTDVILPFHDPFICGQLPQAHWPSGLQALGRNSNLRTKAHLPTVGKTGRGIDIHRRRVNSGDKARCVLGIFGEDAIGMSCRVCGDMLDRLLQPFDYLNPKD